MSSETGFKNMGSPPSSREKKKVKLPLFPCEWLILSSCVLDLITAILNAPVTEQPTPADVGMLVSHSKSKMWLSLSQILTFRKQLGARGKGRQNWHQLQPPENYLLRFLPLI